MSKERDLRRGQAGRRVNARDFRSDKSDSDRNMVLEQSNVSKPNNGKGNGKGKGKGNGFSAPVSFGRTEEGLWRDKRGKAVPHDRLDSKLRKKSRPSVNVPRGLERERILPSSVKDRLSSIRNPLERASVKKKANKKAPLKPRGRWW